jgi:hypothetical protein
MKTSSLKLPDDLNTRVSAVTTRRRFNKAEAVPNALDAYLARQPPPQSGAALEPAGGLFGSPEGPADLSRRDEHGRTYGKSVCPARY